MSTFTYVPTWGAQVKRKPRTRVAQFGDGYAQRTADGINTNPKIWTLRWTVPPATADLIEDFFDAANAVTPFDWTDLKDVAGQYICTDWDRSYDNYGFSTVNATFVEDFTSV